MPSQGYDACVALDSMTPTVSAYHPEDFPELYALIEAASGPRRRLTRAGLGELLDHPGYEPGRDLFVARDAAGPELVGVRDVRVTARGDEQVPILESWGLTHPTAGDGDVSGALLRTALARATAIVTERGHERGIFQTRCGVDDVASQGTFELHRLRQARVLLSIARPHLRDLTPPRARDGVVLRPYRVGLDDAAWVTAFNDAFADHWGGFMGMSLALWTRYVRRPAFKPEFSLVAWGGPEIAGFGHFRVDDELNAMAGRNEGVMRYIGVRPRWRGRGLGVALTRAGLVLLRDAGIEAVLSGVDSDNPTGARQIYEREGFVTTGQQHLYRVELASAAGR